MSDYAANIIGPADFFYAKTVGGQRYSALYISTGVVAFPFPLADIVDPHNWTRATLVFSVPGFKQRFEDDGFEGVFGAAATVTPATWDLTNEEPRPGWGVDWADAEWDPHAVQVNVRAGIVSKTAGSELLRCAYTVFTILH